MASSTVRHALQGVVGLYSERVKARDQMPFGSPLCWWQHAVREICRTSNDPHAVKNALRFFPTPDNTVVLLSNRGEIWLNTCLHVICEAQAIKVPRCNSPKSTARNIVNIATWRRPPLPWDEDWIISNLMGTTEIPIIADNFNVQIENLFSRTIFQDWVALCFGYRNDFLDKIVRVRDRLVDYSQRYGTAKLASVLNALPSQQPLARWILSTAICGDTSSDPTTSLQFIIDPIEQLLTEHQRTFPLLIQHLLIIEARFHSKVVVSDRVNWSAPFSMDFSLWQSISNLPPQALAISITEDVENLFSATHLKGISQNWSDFSEDILACLKVDIWVTDYVKELVDCLLSSHPRNIHTATAIGLALSASEFHPCEPWAAWDIIKPDGNFNGCTALIAEGDCFPYLHPLSIAASIATDQPHASSGKRQKISRAVLGKIRDGKETESSVQFEMREQQNTSLGILQGEQEVENTVQKRTYKRHPPNYIEHLPPSSSAIYPVDNSSQLKRKFLIDKEQPHTKRAAVAVEDQAGQNPTIERDSNHNKHSSPSYPAKALQKSGNRGRLGIMDLLNPDVTHEGTPSSIDTVVQQVNLAELPKGQYSIVSQVSTPPRYLKNAPTLPGDSTVQIESYEKMNQDPVQHETVPQPAQMLDREKNPAELLATPKPSLGKKVAKDWTGTSASRDLHPDASARTTQDTLDRSRILGPEPLAPTAPENSPKQDFLASRKGSSAEVYLYYPKCLALTDEQCRKIQEIVDPDDIRKFKLWETELQPNLIRLYMTGKSFRKIAFEMEPKLSRSYRTYNNRFRDWCFPVDPIERNNRIKQLYTLVSRLTIPPQASQILSPAAFNEEQRGFVQYSNCDLGKTPHLPQIHGNTRLKRRRIACEAKSRLVDTKPHRASQYPWVENYHKQEISEANLAQATLSSVALEYLRPFSAEALDFLWFLHFDLGLSASSLLGTFWPHLKETVWQAHRADFERRDIALSCGYTAGSEMSTGLPIMLKAYSEMYCLCDISPNAIQYNWIPDIFKFGMTYPRFRCRAFQQFFHLSEKMRIEVMKEQLCGPLTFPGLKDMPESTFHRQCSKERPYNVASPKPGRKIGTRSCAGCVTCKREEGKCDGLQSSSKNGMVKESSAAPPSIFADADQINPEDAVFEYHRPATFYPSPSTKLSLLEFKRANGNREGFWYLERDNRLDETCRLVPSEQL